MFRPFVLLLVLTMMSGPNAAMLCTAWCQPDAERATCHDQATGTETGISASDHCRSVAAIGGPYVTPDARRGLQVVQGDAADIARHPLADVAVSAPSKRSSPRDSSRDRRPRTTSLRI